MKPSVRRVFSLLLCIAMTLSLFSGVLVPPAGATAADDQESSLLGELSASYESRGSADEVATVYGDLGGTSYGLYMFASNAGTPRRFFEWLLASDNVIYQSFGGKLYDAYYTGVPGFGPLFNAAWKECAEDNLEAFAQAQRDYAYEAFYLSALSALRDKSRCPSFDMNNYSIALRNVLWSRAIQHGSTSAANIFVRAFASLGGFANQPESELIRAVYAESGSVVSQSDVDFTLDYTMSGTTAEKYGIDGKALRYYSGNSSDIQVGVYIRLWVNEPAQAQAMLAQYGYTDAPLQEGLYTVSLPANNKLFISPDLSLGSAEQLRLTYYASGYYTVSTESDTRRLTCGSGSAVSWSAPAASDRQFWELVRYNSGFALKNRATGRYLTVTSPSAGGAVQSGEEMFQWQFTPGNAGWTLSGANYPSLTNKLVEGSSGYYLRGTLHSTHTIKTVKSQIFPAGSSSALHTASASPDSTYYDLSRLDNATPFSALKAGNYVFSITAADSAGNHYELTSPFVVQAQETISVTYTLAPNGGTCSPTSLTYEPGQSLSGLPTPSRSGYAFAGWFDEDGRQVSAASTAYAEDTTLTAHWNKLYTYTFYDYDGKTVLASGSLTKGEAILAPADPQRAASATTYYTFTGWSGYSAGMTMGESNCSFTAQYQSHAIPAVTEMTATGSYRLSGGYLRKISAGTTAAQLLASLSPAQYITVQDQNGKAVTGKVATGMTVSLTVNGSLIQQVSVVVTGDVNGDGLTDITDMAQINAHLLKRTTLTGARAQAADLNGDGVIDVTDFAQILAVTLGRRTISPQ